MRFFLLNTLGNDQDKSLAFIDSPPEGLGIYDYCMSRGKPIGERYPADAKVFLKDKSPGIKLSALLGNTEGYLIVNTAMKDVIVALNKREIELLPFTLFNHKRRVHSKDYWIVNPLGSIDCLNKGASDIKYLDASKRKVVSVKKFVLDPGKLGDSPALFRVPEDLSQYFVSGPLVKALKEGGFSNVYVTEVGLQESKSSR